ncbi:MAG TPA: hypothetical protein VFW02_01235, partial [Candidatus Limnocylindrales bacterium]|nr:hypothetical protein [Candidatus Limnocylindrales bacterium]
LRLHARSDDEPIFRADPAGLIEQLLLPPPEAPEMLPDIRPSSDGSWCAWRSSASAPRSAKSTASWN